MSPVISETGEARFVDDLEIEQWIHDRFGFVPHPFWIGYCRELYLAETITLWINDCNSERARELYTLGCIKDQSMPEAVRLAELIAGALQ